MITVGIDEVGRGCWAGPLVAAAVILGKHINGLADSKKLSKTQRTALDIQIRATAQAFGIGWVSPAEVDAIGLTKAVGLAMARAVAEVKITFDEIIIDGNINYFPDDTRAQAIIKADTSIPAVSAASIIAKVARDRFMTENMHDTYPLYGFDKHVGYGTQLHRQMLQVHGVTDIHRLSFRPMQLLQTTTNAA